ncbi:MAG TPA: DNA cytosine methyltransferase [Solirubrobacterales bacterium]|nr:DNA cytosine methyltransferase [Solirubrobacterales bacterium]
MSEADGGIRQSGHNLLVAASSYTAVSLYAGAGGLDLGFSKAEFKLLWAIDSDRHAVSTYKANLGDHIVHGQLPEDEPPTDLRPDLVIGGPPCQGFSVIGRMDPNDPRSQHVHTFLDVVERLEPRAFCMENVRALARAPRWKEARESLVQRARELEYRVELLVLNAADYGVPQARQRMFLIGIQGTSPLCPTPVTKKNPLTVRAALSRLPRFGEPGNSRGSTAKVVPALKPVMRPSAYQGSLLFNGSGRPLQLDAPAKTLPASMGGNATPIVDQEELENGVDPWVVSYHAGLRQGRKPRKHAPKRMRRVTVEEASVLQSFPLDWQWKGPQGAMYRQVGNAVPPALAERVAISVRQALEVADATDPTPGSRKTLVSA